MLVTIDTDTLSLDEKGELLRGLVFDQQLVTSKSWHGSVYKYRQTGCYSTFDLNSDFIKINPEKYPKLFNRIKPSSDWDIHVQAYENDRIVVMWWWDGDGDLTIWIKEEPTALQNTDCKKGYGWEEIPAEDCYGKI